MKIGDISCRQFAGIHCPKDAVVLKDGLNIIYGENESGKSTLVNLISRVLFQDVKLDLRSNKDFRESYFPAQLRDGKSGGDFADGTLTLETENGKYVLSKTWGKMPDCTLVAPGGGIFQDAEKISEMLKEVLVFGEGVYSNMLLSPQSNTDSALKSILSKDAKDDKDELKDDVLRAITRVFAESDSIPIDSIAQAIQAKISALGDNWDANREMPVGWDKGVKKQKGIGELVRAFYEVKKAEDDLNKADSYERDAERAKADFEEKDRAYAGIRKTHENYKKAYEGLQNRNLRQEQVESRKKSLDEIRQALAEWPQLSKKCERANVLREELQNAQLLACYESSKILHDEIETSKIERAKCPDEEDKRRFNGVLRRLSDEENKLRGMNLNADIRMMGGNSVKITALRTGEELKADGVVAISEAVKITVPGVMEMELTPKNVNAEEVQARLDECRADLKQLLQKFGVSDADEFDRLYNLGAETDEKIRALSIKLERGLKGRNFSEVERSVKEFKAPPRAEEEISAEIALLGSDDILTFIISAESKIAEYEKKYGSIDALKGKAFDAQSELEEAQRALENTSVPTEYEKITDPAGGLKTLEDELPRREREREAALRAKTEAEVRYAQLLSESKGDFATRLQDARRALAEKKELYNHWKHIEKVFFEQKEKVNANPLVDLAENFAENLRIITDGKVDSGFESAERLSPELYSRDAKIDYRKLSEGTKETTSLAFRLAVLDHLFPNGGGVMVLDDPFANMDAGRTERSIALVEEHAKRHQIILLTCKEELCARMDGTKIELHIR